MRKRFDPNEIIVKETYAELVLYHKDQTERTRTLISLEDVEKVSKERWFVTEYNYARCCLKETGKYTFLHRFLLNIPDDIFVDHINQNKLDNRRENLRTCNYSQNGMNRGLQSNSTTGYKGVNFDKRRSLYRAHIKLNGKQTHLGYFEKIEDAVKARREAEPEYFKEFTPVI